MSWDKLKEKVPPALGWYQVVKFYEGTKKIDFFEPILPRKSIEFMQWKTNMKVESDFIDRCIYVKYKCFVDEFGLEQKPEDILYWFELDPVPE